MSIYFQSAGIHPLWVRHHTCPSKLPHTILKRLICEHHRLIGAKKIITRKIFKSPDSHSFWLMLNIVQVSASCLMHIHFCITLIIRYALSRLLFVELNTCPIDLEVRHYYTPCRTVTPTSTPCKAVEGTSNGLWVRQHKENHQFMTSSPFRTSPIGSSTTRSAMTDTVFQISLIFLRIFSISPFHFQPLATFGSYSRSLSVRFSFENFHKSVLFLYSYIRNTTSAVWLWEIFIKSLVDRPLATLSSHSMSPGKVSFENFLKSSFLLVQNRAR